MYIESINITAFGNLRGVSLGLSGGMNIIEGANESGKSTAAAFIKYIFYGFSGKPERERYLSFGTSTAEGSLVVSDGGKRYRIERRTVGTRDTCKIVELEGNTVIADGANPGERFFGVPEELYVNTSYVRQLDGGKVNGKNIGEAADNILFSADESVNLQRALKKIDEARVELLHKNGKGGKIFELSREIEACREARIGASEINNEIISTEGTLADLKYRMDENDVKLSLLKKQLLAYAAKEKSRRLRSIGALKEQLENNEKKLEALKREYTYDGFLPDAEYISKLRTLEKELDMADRRLASLDSAILTAGIEEEKTKASVNPVELEREAFFSRCGGKDALRIQVDEISSRRRLMTWLGVAASALFVGVAALAVFLFMLNAVYGFLLGVAAAALLFGTIVCVVSSKRCQNEIDNIYDRLSVADTVEFMKITDENLTEKTEIKEKPSEKEKLEAERAVSELKRSSAELALRDECRRYGGTDADATAKKAEKAIEEIAALSAETEKYRAAYNSASEQLSESEFENELEEPAELPADFDPKEARRGFEFLTKANESMREKTHELEVRLSGLCAKAEHPSELYEKEEALRYKLDKLTARHDAYVMAYDALSAAGNGLRDTLSPRLSEYAGRAMSVMTGGKYDTIGVDRSMAITFTPDCGGGEMTFDSSYMSAGTSDAAYISLRLALINLLYRKSAPPLIFDESFSRLDDDRLANTMHLLRGLSEKAGMQIIILTAMDRESRAAGSFVKKISL